MFVRLINAFQKTEVQSLSLSDMMETGDPKVPIQLEKNREATRSAVSFWHVGIKRVKPKSRHVQVKIMLWLLTFGNGPTKSNARCVSGTRGA